MRSNRSEAQRELLRYANLQEQVFVDTRSYATDMKGLGHTSVSIRDALSILKIPKQITYNAKKLTEMIFVKLCDI